MNDILSRIEVRPTYPAESFGYIERGESIDDTRPVFRVVKFREKPNAETAQEYLRTKRFYWNAGIFVWRAAAVRSALERFEPAMAEHLLVIGNSLGTSKFSATLEREFPAIQGKSIDYAVMERYDNVLVIEEPFDWDDVGSWQSLARLRGGDADGNSVVGRHVGLNTSGTIVKTDSDHLVVTLGLTDCIVVHTSNATLVANKHDEESIRKLVEILRARGWSEYL